VFLTAQPSASVASYTWDFNGSGSNDLKCYTHSSLKAEYQQVGLYLAQVIVTDASGNRYSDTVIVNVLDYPQTNNFFTQKWEGLKNALTLGDIAGATSYFTPAVQALYSQRFSQIAASLPSLAEKMGSFTLVKMTDAIAEGDLRSEKDGVSYSFQVLFIRDENGNWGILSY
jgi:hypothetical protein